jgi:hypothetical protein
MNEDGRKILEHLHTVAAERARRTADPALGHRVLEVKRYQHARFALTYRDLLEQPLYGAAARFFLEELYGPDDFSDRDAQFARVVPGLVRLFPAELVRTVRVLGELHALSETLDSRMAEQIPALPLDGAGYGHAWRATGEPAKREQQIALTLDVGEALARYTRNPIIRHSLRLMRGPAAAAGLGALQRFLESGFDTFRALRDPSYFLNTVAQRERALAADLFADGSGPNFGYAQH